MNEVLKTIQSRRSCRAFLERPVPREALEEIACAAACAPSARNQQEYRFTVLTDPDLRERLRLAVIAAKGCGDDYNFYRPAALILCSVPRDYPYGREDCACAMENILLAAHSLGLGAVWINQLSGNCDHPQLRAVLRDLSMPDDHVVYGSAAIGYPGAPPKPIEHRAEIIWK